MGKEDRLPSQKPGAKKPEPRDAHVTRDFAPKPVPALQTVGFHGTMREFNERVQTAVDAHERTQGYRPSPGLVFDVARSPVPAEKLPLLFQVPRTKAGARAGFFRNKAGVVSTSDP